MHVQDARSSSDLPVGQRSVSLTGDLGISRSRASLPERVRRVDEGRSPAKSGCETAAVSVVLAARTGSGLVVATDSRTLVYSSLGHPWAFDSECKLVTMKMRPLLAAATGATRVGPWSFAETVRSLEGRIPPGELFDGAADALARHLAQAFDAASPSPSSALQVLLAGYEDGSARTCTVVLGAGEEPSMRLHDAAFGLAWIGETTALDRVVNGIDRRLAEELEGVLGGAGRLRDERAAEALRSAAVAFPLDAMPLEDAISLVVSLVDLAKTYHRMLPGVSTVGGATVVGVLEPDGTASVRRLGAATTS